MVRVLFVCLGNICRSPTAEGVFRDLVRREGLAERIKTDSCGTSGWHIGDPPDSRACAEAERRGIRQRRTHEHVEVVTIAHAAVRIISGVRRVVRQGRGTPRAPKPVNGRLISRGHDIPDAVTDGVIGD